MLLGYRSKLPPTIGLTPTATTIFDALRVSEYMDHVVQNWIDAYVSYRIALAENERLNREKDFLSQIITPEAASASVAFREAHTEMVERWKEYAADFNQD